MNPFQAFRGRVSKMLESNMLLPLTDVLIGSHAGL